MREATILTVNKNSLLTIRSLFIALGIIFGALLSITAFSAHYAYAAGEGPPFGSGSGGAGDQSGGGAGSPGGGSGSSGPAKGTTKHSDSAPYDANNHNFTLACETWGGSGSYRESTGCNASKTYVTRSGNVPGGYVCGASAIYACDNLSAAGSSAANIYTGGDPQVCGAQGNKSADGQIWHVNVNQIKRTVQTWDGEKWVTTANFVWSQTVRTSFVGCTYPRSEYSYQTCFWNYQGSAYFSTNRGTIASGGTFVANRAKQAGDPPAPSGGSGAVPPRCAETSSAKVYIEIRPTTLGYYRLGTTYNYRTYTNERWISSINGSLLRNNWTQGGTLNGGSRDYYAWTCRPSGNAGEGSFKSAGAIPNRDAYLNPANCEVANKWKCALSTPTTIGLDKAAVAAGRISPTSPTSIMRNGQKVPLNWSTVRIIDQTGGRNTDVTNGNAGPGVKDVTNISYNEQVKAGSSPFYGTNPKDVNSGNQYFKKYTSVNSNTVSPFNQWKNQNNQHLDEGVAFVWASTDSAHPWVATRVYKVYGTFRIPQATSISNKGITISGYTWQKGVYDCINWQENSNGTRTNKGLLTGTTNQLSVVRSTNDK